MLKKTVLSMAVVAIALNAGTALADTSDKRIALSNNYAGNSWRQAMLQTWEEVGSQAIADGVIAQAGGFKDRIVSFYWPFRGEPDLRPLIDHVLAEGGTAALPVVVEKGRPLVFRSWRPGEALEPGVWKIPVPKDGRIVTPDIVLAPRLSHIGLMEFYRAREAIQEGRECVQRMLPEIRHQMKPA